MEDEEEEEKGEEEGEEEEKEEDEEEAKERGIWFNLNPQPRSINQTREGRWINQTKKPMRKQGQPEEDGQVRWLTGVDSMISDAI